MISRFSDASDKIRSIKSVREELVDSEILNLFEVDLSDISRIYVGPDIWEGKRDKWEYERINCRYLFMVDLLNNKFCVFNWSN